MYMYVFVTLRQTPNSKYSTASSPQKENIDVCINMAPSILTDNKRAIRRNSQQFYAQL